MSLPDEYDLQEIIGRARRQPRSLEEDMDLLTWEQDEAERIARFDATAKGQELQAEVDRRIDLYGKPATPPAPVEKRRPTAEEISARIGEQYTITRELTMELVGIEARQLRNLVADGKLDQIHRGGPILAASLRRYLGL